MIISNSAASLPVISVSVDTDKTSIFKDVMSGNIDPESFFRSAGFSQLITNVVNTAYEFPFKGLRVLKHDAITIAVDQQYSSNALFGFVITSDTTTRSIVAMNRRGKRNVTPGVVQVNSGVVIESPITMLISALCQKEQIIQSREREELSVLQQSAITSKLGSIDEQIDLIMNDSPSIMMMGEQAVAIDNGEIYFHQPVSVNWLAYLESVDFDLVPESITRQVSDFRARTVDVFKGVTGSTGTIEEIEDQLDTLGIGSHLKSTPWIKLPNQPAFDFEITTGMRSFINENASSALGLFYQYLRTGLAGLVVDNKDIARSMSDMTLKLKRIGALNDFDIDSQDGSALDVAAHAFSHVLSPMGKEEKERVIMEAGALLDLRYGRINFDADTPDGLTRADIVFYKKAIGSMRRSMYEWPSYLVDNTSIGESLGKEALFLTLPSGLSITITIADNDRFGFYNDFAISAIRNPSDSTASEMVKFIEEVEGIFVYLDDKTVTVNDIVPDFEGNTIRVGGVYRKLCDVLHSSLCSPNFVIVVPVGQTAN